jgi:pimeloyl-ACP methyl ester carboxylesterase
VEVAEHNAEIGGVPVHWLAAGGAPVLYLHGVPNSGGMWRPFLARSGGIAPDLPGFGLSGKGGDFDYSIEGYSRFLEALVEHLRLEKLSLVMHDWGGVGLDFAQRFPQRIRSLVLIALVPLLPGYRWHSVARLWRRAGVGELAMGVTTRRGMARQLPEEVVEDVWPHFDHGTQRAILRLYRSAPEDVLARAGERLGELTCPGLVAWGAHDPYIPHEFAQRYADALGGDTVVQVLDGGHWVWLDRPELIERVSGFIAEP